MKVLCHKELMFFIELYSLLELNDCFNPKKARIHNYGINRFLGFLYPV